MLEQIGVALGPWPLAQFFFFGLVALGGIFAIVRGARSKPDEPSMEERRAQWAAYEQLRTIADNTDKIVESQRHMVEVVNRLVGVIWNRNQP
jgi:hypothetical protein